MLLYWKMPKQWLSQKLFEVERYYCSQKLGNIKLLKIVLESISNPFQTTNDH